MASRAEQAFAGIIEFADATYRRYVEALSKVALELDRRLLDEVRSIPTDSRGRFQRSPNTLARLREVQVRLVHHLAEAGFPGAQRELVDAYPELLERTERAWRLAAGSKTGFLQEDLEAFRALAGAQLDQFANVGAEGMRILQGELQRSVLGEASYEDLATKLRDHLETSGLEDRAGKGMWRHAATLADTSMSEMQRFMNLKIANRAGITHFQYFGPLDKATRPFCRRVLSRRPPIYTREEIDALDNDQTAEGSVMIAAGGYNCRHVWIPVVEDRLATAAAGEFVPASIAPRLDRELALQEGLRTALHDEAERFRRAFAVVDTTISAAERAVAIGGTILDYAGQLKVAAEVTARVGGVVSRVLPPGNPVAVFSRGAGLVSQALTPLVGELDPRQVLNARSVLSGGLAGAANAQSWLSGGLWNLHRQATLVTHAARRTADVFKVQGVAAKSEALVDALIFGRLAGPVIFDAGERLVGVGGEFAENLVSALGSWRSSRSVSAEHEIEDLVDEIRRTFGVADGEPIGVRMEEGKVVVYARTPERRAAPLRKRLPPRYSDLEVEGALRAVADVGDETVLTPAQQIALYKLTKISEQQLESVLAKSGLPLRGRATAYSQRDDYMVVYHGSRHAFDEFDASKIGTGEGAQAFGWGLYFAEAAEVARTYLPAPNFPTFDLRSGYLISPRTQGTLNRLVVDSHGDLEEAKRMATSGVRIKERETRRIRELLEKDPESKLLPGALESEEALLFSYREALAALEDGAVTPKLEHGHLYEVRLLVRPENLLDWDAPLRTQSKHVQDAVLQVQGRTGWTVTDPGLPDGSLKVTSPTGSVSEFVSPSGLRRFLEGGRQLSQPYKIPGHEVWDLGSGRFVVHDTPSGRFVLMHGNSIISRHATLEDAARGFVGGLDWNAIGSQHYAAISRVLGGDEAASQALREAGVPGHRFLDQMSRGLGGRQLVPDLAGIAVKSIWDARVSRILPNSVDRKIAEVIFLHRKTNQDLVDVIAHTVIGDETGKPVQRERIERVVGVLTRPATRNVVIYPGEERRIEVAMVNGRPIEVNAPKTIRTISADGETEVRDVATAADIRTWAEQRWARDGDENLIPAARAHFAHESRMLAAEINPDQATHLEPFGKFHERLMALDPDRRLAVTEHLSAFLLSEIDSRLQVSPARADFGFGTWGVEPNPSAAFYYTISDVEADALMHAFAWAAKQAEVWSWTEHKGGMRALRRALDPAFAKQLAEGGEEVLEELDPDVMLAVRVFDASGTRMADSQFRLQVYQALNERLGGALQGFSPAIVDDRMPGMLMLLRDLSRDTIAGALFRASEGERNDVTAALASVSKQFKLDLRASAGAVRLRRAVIDWQADRRGQQALRRLRELGRRDVEDWLVRDLGPRAERRFEALLTEAEIGRLERFARTRDGVHLRTLPNVADAKPDLIPMMVARDGRAILYPKGHAKAGQPIDLLTMEGLPPEIRKKVERLAAGYGFTRESAKEQYRELLFSVLKRGGPFPLARARDMFYVRYHERIKKAARELNYDFRDAAAAAAAISPDAAGEVNDIFAIDIMRYLRRNDALEGETLRLVNLEIARGKEGALATQAKHLAEAEEHRARIELMQRDIRRRRLVAGGELRTEIEDEIEELESKIRAKERYARNAHAESERLHQITRPGMSLTDLDSGRLVYGLWALRRMEFGAGFQARRGYNNYRKAVDVLLKRRTIAEVLPDEKVKAFANNILDPWESARRGIVTIDFHMINAAARRLGADKITKIVGTPKYLGVNLGVRPMLADIVRELAVEMSPHFGERLSGLRVQEMIWNEWRRRAEEVSHIPSLAWKKSGRQKIAKLVTRIEDELVGKPLFDEVKPSDFVRYRKKAAGGRVTGGVAKSVYLSPTTPVDFRKAGTKTYYWKDQSVGFALSAEGDLQNVFNGSNTPGAGAEAVIRAIELGAKTLDCFAGHLPAYYKRFGFVEVRREPFADQWAPAGWDYAKSDRPDVVYMEYRGGDPSTLRFRFPL